MEVDIFSPPNTFTTIKAILVQLRRVKTSLQKMGYFIRVKQKEMFPSSQSRDTFTISPTGVLELSAQSLEQ